MKVDRLEAREVFRLDLVQRAREEVRDPLEERRAPRPCRIAGAVPAGPQAGAEPDQDSGVWADKRSGLDARLNDWVQAADGLCVAFVVDAESDAVLGEVQDLQRDSGAGVLRP